MQIQNVKSGVFVAIDQNGDIITKVKLLVNDNCNLSSVKNISTHYAVGLFYKRCVFGNPYHRA